MTDMFLQSIQIKYTIGPSVAHNGYHIPIIRSSLTRNLGVLFHEIKEELAESCKDVIPQRDGKLLYTV